MARETKEVLDGINKSLFGEEGALEVGKAIDLLGETEEYVTFDSDTDYGKFDSFIEEEFVGSVAFFTENFRLRYSDDCRSLLFTIKPDSALASANTGLGDLDYIIACPDSDLLK